MTETANKLEFSALHDPRYPVHQVGDRLAKGSFFFTDILSKGLEVYAA